MTAWCITPIIAVIFFAVMILWMASTEDRAIQGGQMMEQHDFIKKIFDAFPNAYINRTNEVIISEKGNVFFGLSNVNSNDELINKILAWCSRDACKSILYRSEKLNKKHHAFIRHGCNKILGVELSEDDWWVIYERLGNNVNPQLAKRFIESNFDMSVLKED